MDSQYFGNYGGQGVTYDQCWLNHTWNAPLFFETMDSVGVRVDSVFDVGAANGKWLDHLAAFAPGIEIGGIEIDPTMAAQHPMVEHDDARNWKPQPGQFWDVISFNGLAYLDKDEIIQFMDKIKEHCSVFVCLFAYWDNWRWDGQFKPVEKTLLIPYDWSIFFNQMGWNIWSMPLGFVLKYQPERAIPQSYGVSPLLDYVDHDHASCPSLGLDLYYTGSSLRVRQHDSDNLVFSEAHIALILSLWASDYVVKLENPTVATHKILSQHGFGLMNGMYRKIR